MAIPRTVNALIAQLDATRYIPMVAGGVQNLVTTGVVVLLYLGFLLASRGGFERKVVRLFHGFGIPGVMGWVCAIYLSLALVLALFGIETNQRSLEDLDPDREQRGIPAPAQVPGSITS